MHRLLLGLLLLLPGCTFGPTVENYAPAHRAAGTRVTIETTGGDTVAGEVLAVEETGLILRALRPGSDQGRLVRVSYAAIRRGDFADDAVLDISSRYWTPSEQWRRGLRRHSRFPQGLSPDILDRLLRLHGQQTLAPIS